ncbi:MAG: FAD-dependent oxidoreductase [Christensenellales bacterium]|jgi:uncharacterized protein with FMN-binding domain/succinate dehydrogenase/fumarate reductase flavoprotein subunit
MKRLSKKMLVFALAFALIMPSLLSLTQVRAEAYKPGTYEATEQGFGGDVTVKVTLTEDRIESIEVEENETGGIGDEAISQLIEQIISGQTLNLDGVAGATLSSNAFLTALEEALKSAGANIETLKTKEAETAQGEENTDLQFKEGEYFGEANGTGGPVKVKVTLSSNKIESIEVVDDNESAGIGEQVFEILPNQIVASQSLGVDSISGATITSAALKAAVANALKEAGADVEKLKNVEVPSTIEDGEYSYDVVIAGGGLAGLMAALEAAQKGVSVALVEKTGVLGGTSIFASGNLLAATEEKYQKPMYEMWHMRSASQEKNPIDDERLNYLIERSPEAMDLLMNKAGVEFNITIEDIGSQTFRAKPDEKSIKNAEAMSLPSKTPNKKGAALMMEKLAAAVKAAGVDIFMNTPATELIQKDGTVCGLISKTEKYGTKVFNAKAVVLATGDYAKNDEMTDELAPQASGEYSATAIGNTGDGHKMAVAAGGYYYDFQESMSGNFQADPFDLHYVGDPSNNYPFEALLVNWDGERRYAEDGGSHPQKFQFVDETRLNSAWCIMDEPIAQRFNRLEELLEATENGSKIIKVYKEDSIEALAQKAGLPVDNVVASVKRYNEMVAQGKDTDFGKDPDLLEAIDEAPFYIAMLYDATRGNYGGIATDKQGRVITKENNAIPGLFAGGIISSGPYIGDFYPGRQAIAVAVHMGFISGESAAEYALAQLNK